MRSWLLISVLVVVPSIAYAQEEKKVPHPIDKSLEACTDKDSSTAGMVACLDRAYQMWDKELNKSYNELNRSLNPKGKLALKTAQLEWLKYRDAEFKLLENIYSELQGTMYIPVQISNRVEIVKKRALELQERMDMLKER